MARSSLPWIENDEDRFYFVVTTYFVIGLIVSFAVLMPMLLSKDSNPSLGAFLPWVILYNAVVGILIGGTIDHGAPIQQRILNHTMGMGASVIFAPIISVPITYLFWSIFLSP